MQSLPNRGKQAGHAMLEFALVFTPLMALMMAIIDYSMPVFLRATFVHAVREGVRYGITYRTEAGLSHAESIKRVVQNHAMGFLGGSAGLARIQVKFYSPITFNEVTGPTANASGNILEVSVNDYEWNQIVPIWRSALPVRISAISSDRLETLPRGVVAPAPF
ncbi:MAG: pilus assembly protein [Bryobacteraceae bacterium]|nr:pilus assembly protein [Bryobacteraceae bacterium]MDW8377385.1 TadE/TadG family type IV pilus assembly protein [Bryobacterales bacterium]